MLYPSIIFRKLWACGAALLFIGYVNGWSAEQPSGYVNPNTASFLKRIDEGAQKLLNEGKLKTLHELAALKPSNQAIALPPLSKAKLEAPDLHDKLLASTLVVGLYPAGQTGSQNFNPAAGFAIGEGGIITTCAHVMQFDSKQMVTAYPIAADSQGNVYPIVEVLAYDPVGDTCVLRVGDANFPPLPLRPGARTGETVYCLSHPGSNFFIFTSGIISRQDSEISTGRVVKKLDVSCDYSPGSSGGPITDSAGNVIAQVDKILPQLIYGNQETQSGPAATVYNLRMATAAAEILRLADPANRAPLVVPPLDPKVAKNTGSSFRVHTKYALIESPQDFPLETKTKNFTELFDLVTKDPRHGTRHPTFNTWDDKPAEAQQPNFLPFGFTGNLGYYQDPNSSGPPTMSNTKSRDVDFRVTYHDVQGDTVKAAIAVNDTRNTPKAADNNFEVSATITRNAFKLVKLGPPQKDRQAWLALLVDDFSKPADKIPVPELKTAPDQTVTITFTAIDKREVDTSKMRGKVILVDFWATWCGPCVASMPIVEKLYEKYHAQGFEVIGISLDQERAALDGFLKAHPHPWPQFYTDDAFNAIAQRFDIKGIPAFMLIDKEGHATMIDVRNPDTDDIITAKLK